jgi:outer membrane protein assembly factor BamB
MLKNINSCKLYFSGGLSCWVLFAFMLAPQASAKTWNGYQTLWATPVRSQAPCATSLIQPPSDKDRCIRWSPRFAGGPTFHEELRLVLVGADDNMLKAFSLNQGQLVYETELPGNLASQPTLSGNHVLLGTEDGYVLKMDATNGTVLWRIQVDAEVLEPPVVDHKSVYVVTGLDTLYALDIETGQAVWQHKNPLPVGMTLRGQSQPTLHHAISDEKGERLMVGHADGTLTILETRTGKVLKRIELGDSDNFADVDTDPILVGHTVYAAAFDSGIFAIDERNGEIRWTLREKAITQLATDSQVLIAAGPGQALAIDLQSHRVIWRTTFKKGVPGRIRIQGGRVHIPIDLDRIQVMSLKTGEPLQAIGSGLGVSADIDLNQDLLFYLSNSGHLMATSNALTQGNIPMPSRQSQHLPFFND